MYLGVDYYPEHWDINMIDEDIKGIVGLGANIVRIGEFAWHLMEKEEGKFDFTYFDNVIAKLKDKNIKIMFGTPTATFPAWLYKKHPSILSKDENLQVRAFGGRRQYCFNSDIYREYSEKMVAKLIEHYKGEDSIVAWQVDNELGHEGSDMCYCEGCQKKFKEYLKEKYECISNLNETYGTIFWGQTYNNFDEVSAPMKTITTHNPSLLLDWSRFRSYSLNSFAKEQTMIVKNLKGDNQEVTTNVSGGFFSKWFDHAENVRDLDFVSYDNYPVWGGLKEPISRAELAMTHDFNRGLLNKNYWIVEELMGAQGHTVIGYLPRPNQAKMWSYQAFAHGCTNMLYFRWRAMTKGAEQFCFGIVDHDNRYGRKYSEVKSTIEEILPYEELLKAEIKSEIAVLYDYDNIWSWKHQPQSVEFDFTKELMRLYTPFYNINTNIDVIPTSRNFEGYKVLIIPTLQIIDEELASKLEIFASGGGTVIFSFRAGIKDKDNNINFRKTIPCNIKEICGIEITEVESLQNGQGVEIIGVGEYKGKIGQCEVWRDLITPISAISLYNYNDKFYNDKSCITLNEYGKGKVYYVGAGVNNEILKDIAKEIVIDKSIHYIESEEGLEVYSRYLDEATYLIITNHTDVSKNFVDTILSPYESKIIKNHI
ncbi:beta-galactosidase [Clostridium sp.]|jgi:beta-galactosidase|uniref:beta-galactosidase n=1 Tax=Clostridium sp. TaxID=1506 RepID=UPI003EE89F10